MGVVVLACLQPGSAKPADMEGANAVNAPKTTEQTAKQALTTILKERGMRMALVDLGKSLLSFPPEATQP